MDTRAADLDARIRSRGLPQSVAAIAVDGGAAVHPALGYRTEAVSLSPDGPASTVIDLSAREDLVPLWTCGTTTVLSAADGSFLAWDAEEDAPSATWPDFPGAVRSLLTDLWEDEATDDEVAEVAHLLLPNDQVAAALVPQER